MMRRDSSQHQATVVNNIAFIIRSYAKDCSGSKAIMD